MTEQPPERFYTCQQAADLLKISDGYVRQCCINTATTDHPIGRKFGRQWMLTPADIAHIRAGPGNSP